MMIDQPNNPAGTVVLVPELNERYNTTVQEYVEIISDLEHDKKVARVKDIAEVRGVTSSSVSTALGTLRELDLIEHEHYGYVSLTEEGRRLGELLAERHAIIQRFLREMLDLDLADADREACALEHTLSTKTLNGMLRLFWSLKTCPNCGAVLLGERVPPEGR